MDTWNRGEDRRVEKLGERHWYIYTTVCETDASEDSLCNTGAQLSAPWWRRGWDGAGREGVQLIKVVMQQKVTQHSKAIIRQFKENTHLEINGKRKYDLIKLCWLPIGEKNYTASLCHCMTKSSSRYLNSYTYSFEEEQKWCSVLSVTFYSFFFFYFSEFWFMCFITDMHWY